MSGRQQWDGSAERPAEAAGGPCSEAGAPSPLEPAPDATLAALPALPALAALAPGAELLLRGSSHDVLERLIPDDPLGIGQRLARQLARRCLLVDPDQARLLVWTRIARFARRWGGRPALAAWLEQQVEESIDELLREEARLALDEARGAALRCADPALASEHSSGGESGSDWEVDGPAGPLFAHADAAVPATLVQLAGPLGLHPRALWSACRAHNLCQLQERIAFDALLFRRLDVDAAAREARASVSTVARRARRVLDAVLAAAVGTAGSAGPPETPADQNSGGADSPPATPSASRPRGDGS